MLDHKVGICLTLKETSKLFTKVVLPFYLPMSSYENFNCFNVFANNYYCLLSFSHSSDCEMVSVIWFRFAFL